LTSITIPESVTSIGNGAFSYCSDLTDITVNWTTTPPAINGNALTLRNIILYVPEGTTAIYETAEVWKEFTIVEQSNCPSGTFGTNDALTWKLCEGTITISGTGEMPGFGYQDFDTDLPPWHSYKRIITAVVVESGVESIGSFAFYGYDNLESITLPESVSSIRRYAFSRSNGLASVIIPETVTSIGEFAFWDCTRLTEITVASDNPSYCSEAGVLFDKEKTTLIQYPGGKTGSYTVPESVTSIGDCAFMYCYSLEAVSLSKNVNSIGRQAFYGCSGLTSVTFPASVTSIENGAFTNCSNLIEMTVDANNSSFSSEDGVLFDKSKATLLQYPTGRTDDSYTIPASVTAIGNDAFSYCTGLKSIILPEMLTSIGNDAFFGCSSLTSITLPATVTSIENYAFYGNNSLTDVIVNWTTTPLEINTHVFAYLTLSNITLHVPYGTTAIYEAAEIWKEFDIVEQPCPSGTFGDGDALAWELCEGTLTISGVGVMPDYDSSNNRSPWYSYREEITDVIIESGVESIGAWAFHGCRQLQSVGLFPASLLNAIGEAAFHGCRSLKSVTLPEALTSIGEAAFVSCVSLESIIIPEKVNFIGNSAFVDCSGLKSIIIPESVTSIGEAAFYRCGSLESIILPESLTSIGVAAFSESNSLTEITVASNNPAFSSEGGVLFDKNKETIIQYPIGKTNNSYTIPESVTSIEPHAFAYCRLEYITIPESVTSIERWTFAYSYNLKSITIPESVTSIGTLALAGCSKLADITVNWTATPPAINSDVFYELTLSNITLHVPAGTTAIYEAAEVWSGFTIVEQSNNCPSGTFGANDALAWELCDGTLAISGSGAMPDYGYDNPAPWVSHREDILAVVIESGVERIGVWSFGLCIYLESIIIPESVTSIGYSAFLDCHRLKSVTLPEALTSIEAATFGACGSLESIIIPEKVNSIGKEAFYGCVSLTSITIPASVTSIGVAVFGECHRLTEIAVASNNPAFSSEGGVLFDKNK
jgi:hypothetical protein